MPEVNGVDLIHVLREQWPKTRVLFMSAFPAEVLVREGLDNPDVMFLAKPFTRDELLTKVVCRAPWAPHARRRRIEAPPAYLVTLTTRLPSRPSSPRASSLAASKRLS